MARKIPAASVAGIFLCLLAGCSGTTLIKNPDSGDIRQDFLSIALQQEYSKRDTRLHRWEIPNIPWYGTIPPALQPALSDLLTSAGDASGRIFHQTSIDDSRLFIDIAPKALQGNWHKLSVSAKQQKALQRKHCFFLVKHRQQQIQYAYIFIDQSLSHNEQQHCLSEEILQAMGLFADNARIKESIFRDGSHRNTPSTTDWKLLNLLYSDSLSPGLTRTDVLHALSERH